MSRQTIPQREALESIVINGRRFPVVSSTPARNGNPRIAKGKAHRTIERVLDGEPVTSGTLTLSSPPPSVNSLFFNSKKGRGKTLAYRNWRVWTDREIRQQPSWHVPGKVKIRLEVYGSRADADNLCKAPIDALVAAGRIQDDRNVVEVRAIHMDCEYSGVRGTLIEIVAVAR
jgi:Holliday junction resolvase RusA-like endonuclease